MSRVDVEFGVVFAGFLVEGFYTKGNRKSRDLPRKSRDLPRKSRDLPRKSRDRVASRVELPFFRGQVELKVVLLPF